MKLNKPQFSECFLIFRPGYNKMSKEVYFVVTSLEYKVIDHSEDFLEPLSFYIKCSDYFPGMMTVMACHPTDKTSL